MVGIVCFSSFILDQEQASSSIGLETKSEAYAKSAFAKVGKKVLIFPLMQKWIPIV